MYKNIRHILLVAILLSINLSNALVDNPKTLAKHAKIARELVQQASWAAVGTISTKAAIKDYPMVNVISVNDRYAANQSTGRIQFLLTDIDYTGPDWQHNNKATFLFTAEQLQLCSRHKPNPIDPMEPICPRVIISGRIKKLHSNSQEYEQSLEAFMTRHPAAKIWLRVHTFYLCELEIENVIVLYTNGGPLTVKPGDYYSVKL